MATWRSQDVPATGTMPVQIIRSTRVEERVYRGNQWVQAAPNGVRGQPEQVYALLLVPAFKANPRSAKFGAANDIYCQCHQSV
jgi:hypothetical protein